MLSGRVLAATVYKMLEELLPPDTRLSQECRELFVECCTEFINLVSSESLDVSEKDGKKIIGPEHVIKAVEVREPPAKRLAPSLRSAALLRPSVVVAVVCAATGAVSYRISRRRRISVVRVRVCRVCRLREASQAFQQQGCVLETSNRRTAPCVDSFLRPS